MAVPYDSAKRAVSSSDPAYPGQAVYTARSLRGYDPVVVHLSNSLIWRCPARVLRRRYHRHMTEDHLDVGPGTGYYLDRCGDAVRHPRITLFDANTEVLRFAAHRIRRFGPTIQAGNVLEPSPLPTASFRSIGLGYVLHCLPGPIEAKAAAFDHLRPLLVSGGVVFGATVLHDGVHHTRLARSLLRVYNRKGIFANTGDDLDGLERALAARFDRYELDVVGSVALFAAWRD